MTQRELDAEIYARICEQTIVADNRGASRLWALAVVILLLASLLAWLRFQVHADENWIPRVLSLVFPLRRCAGERVKA